MSRRGGGRRSDSRPAEPAPVRDQSFQRGTGRSGGGAGRSGGGGAGRRPGQGGGRRGSYSGVAETLAPTQAPAPTPALTPTPAPAPAPAPVPECGSSSSTSLSQEMQQRLTLGTQAPAVASTSSKALRFPARPGFGTQGHKCVVRANHFMVQVADKDIHHYDVNEKLNSASLCRCKFLSLFSINLIGFVA